VISRWREGGTPLLPSGSRGGGGYQEGGAPSTRQLQRSRRSSDATCGESGWGWWCQL
jgi:hypothetical protein